MSIRNDIVDDLKNQIIGTVDKHYKHGMTTATDFVKDEIAWRAHDFSGNIADKIHLNIPYPCRNISVDCLYRIIDDVPLTRSEYNLLEEFIKQQKKIIVDKISDDYRKAGDIIEDRFKDYLFKSSSVYHMRVSDAKKSEIFNKMYQAAYDDGHSSGYNSIESAFEAKDKIVDSIASVIATI